jgi:hypothetical protein
VIDTAIRENRANEYLLYGFAILFVALGTGSFVYSVISGHWTLSIGSALESGLFYPAMRAVQQIRRENQQIRLLEIPLNHASTADEAAAALHKTFSKEFGDNKGKGDARTKVHSE